jgi:hypothetical protein
MLLPFVLLHFLLGEARFVLYNHALMLNAGGHWRNGQHIVDDGTSNADPFDYYVNSSDSLLRRNFEKVLRNAQVSFPLFELLLVMIFVEKHMRHD